MVARLGEEKPVKLCLRIDLCRGVGYVCVCVCTNYLYYIGILHTLELSVNKWLLLIRKNMTLKMMVSECWK